VPKADGITS